jgi:hypothetical protein
VQAVAGVRPRVARGLPEHPDLLRRRVLCLTDVVSAPVTSSSTPPNKICATSSLRLPPRSPLAGRGGEGSGDLWRLRALRCRARSQRCSGAALDGLPRGPSPCSFAGSCRSAGGGWAPSNKRRLIRRSRLGCLVLQLLSLSWPAVEAGERGGVASL